MSVYPHVEWQPWRFTHAARGFWDDTSNTSKFLEWFVQQAGLGKLSADEIFAWGGVPVQKVLSLKGKTLLTKSGGWHSLLKNSKNWKGGKGRKHYHTQNYLVSIVRALFPQQEIKTDFKHPGLVFPSTFKMIELDIFLPKLNLAFEYNGHQHYHYNALWGQSEAMQEDAIKFNLCSAAGITLIQIPYWWDYSLREVIKILKHRCPQIDSILETPSVGDGV